MNSYRITLNIAVELKAHSEDDAKEEAREMAEMAGAHVASETGAELLWTEAMDASEV